jgi:NADH:ubiquinone oxidoreductase subunit F (NADH-binding)
MSADVLPIPERWPHLLLPASSYERGPDAVSPTDLRLAVAGGAFAGLRKAVHEMTAGEIVNVLVHSGLRGRGGFGFPTSEKWRACALAQTDRRYVVVHAYQADPGAFGERVLLERNPYAVLEGAAIAAVAVGASEIVVALRADAAEAVAAIETAAREAVRAGYLGSSVLGSGREILLRVVPLRGAYMLGEETVLLAALEGRRGQPEQQPPYPTTRGLYGKPTLVHNPQTLAVIPGILTGAARGAPVEEEPAGRLAGTKVGPAGRQAATQAETALEAPQGTILVQVSGSVVRPGVVEVPIGIALGDILALAGGLPDSRRLKALLVGGPSGGILPASAVKLEYQYEALRDAGAHMGSGSIAAIDDRTCLVDLASSLTRFCADVACGKTIPCRIGLRRLAEIGARICEGQPRGDEIARLTDLAADISASRLCPHEANSTLPLLSLVRYFRDELDAHLVHSTCPTGTCRMPAPSRSRAGS